MFRRENSERREISERGRERKEIQRKRDKGEELTFLVVSSQPGCAGQTQPGSGGQDKGEEAEEVMGS